MTAKSTNRSASQRGSGMVEFGIILSVYLLLIFGFLQFAVAFFIYCNAAYASQIAVRYAVVHGGNSSSPCTAANISNIVSPLLLMAPANSATISSSWSPDVYTGSTVTVSVLVTYPTAIPFSNLSSLTVGATSRGTIIY